MRKAMIDFKIILLGQGFKKMSFGDCRFGCRSQKHFLEAFRKATPLKEELTDLTRFSASGLMQVK
jgi:hypothetical protein